MADPKKELQYVNKVERAVQSLTDEDWDKLDLAAVGFAKAVAIDPMWLLDEALERTLDGRRRWPPNNPDFFSGLLVRSNEKHQK